MTASRVRVLKPAPTLCREADALVAASWDGKQEKWT